MSSTLMSEFRGFVMLISMRVIASQAGRSCEVCMSDLALITTATFRLGLFMCLATRSRCNYSPKSNLKALPHELMQRDWPMVMGLTVALFVMAYGFKGEGRVNRVEGGILLLAYVVYTAWLGMSMVS